jgi:hypothetical protein
MFLNKIFTLKDIAKNHKKKAIFIILGFIIIIIGFILLKNVSNQYLRQIISGLIAIVGVGYFIIGVLFNSFFKPIYLFKNNIFRLFFPLIFNWSSLIFYIIFKRTEMIAIVSLLLVFIGYLFSGLIAEFIPKKIVYYLHLLFNWLFSRFFLAIFLFINIINLLNYIYKQ